MKLFKEVIIPVLFFVGALSLLISALIPKEEKEQKSEFYRVCVINGNLHRYVRIDEASDRIEVGDKLYINPIAECKK